MQHHGHSRGPTVNQGECEHLRIQSTQRIYYSASSVPVGFDLTRVRLDEAKYLGAYLASLLSNRKLELSCLMGSYRFENVTSAFVSFTPSSFMEAYGVSLNNLIDPDIRIDGPLLSPAQLTKLNSVHFKSLRRISKFFIGFWSPLLMADLTFSTRKIPTPSQLHSQQRLQLLGPRSLIQTLRIS